jgi:hydrogenase maturation protease
MNAAKARQRPADVSVPQTLVLGLGNPLLGDDGVGVRVAGQLRPRVEGRQGIRVEEECLGGLGLMERMVGFERVIVVDAVRSGAQPGTIHHLTPHTLPTYHSYCVHDVNLPTAMHLGKKAGFSLPAIEKVLIIGIEVDDVWTFCEGCTPQVEAAIPHAVEAVMAVLASERESP